MGPSGSGKSKLMNILECLDTPTSGRYWFGGEDVSRLNESQLAHVRNRRIGFVFQQFQLLPKPAWRNALLPLLYRNVQGRRELALQALDQVGLSNRGRPSPAASGGQQQRSRWRATSPVRPHPFDEPRATRHRPSQTLRSPGAQSMGGPHFIVITRAPESRRWPAHRRHAQANGARSAA